MIENFTAFAPATKLFSFDDFVKSFAHDLHRIVHGNAFGPQTSCSPMQMKGLPGRPVLVQGLSFDLVRLHSQSIRDL